MEQERDSFLVPRLINVQWLLKDSNTFITIQAESTRSNGCINGTRARMFHRRNALKWFCTVASIPLSWRTCLRRGGTARPRRWTQTSSALTASRRAGSTVRRDTWWRTATAGWSTCPVGTRRATHCWIQTLYLYILLMNRHLFIKMSMLQCLLLCSEVLSFEIVVTETILKEQTASFSFSFFWPATAENQIRSHSSELEKVNYFQFVFVQWLQLAFAAYPLHLIAVWHLRRQIEKGFGAEETFGFDLR